jgi:hypothetical protein
MPSFAAMMSWRAWPCGSSAAIAFSTCTFSGVGAILDGGIEKPFQPGFVAGDPVHDAHARRRQLAASQLPVDPDQKRYEGSHLMNVGVACDTRVLLPDANGLADRDLEADRLILQLDVTLGAPQCVAHRVRRCGHIVEQAHLTGIEILSEVKAEKIVAERFGSELDEFDLIGDANRRISVFDKVFGQSGLLEQRADIDAFVLGARIDEAGNDSAAHLDRTAARLCRTCHRSAPRLRRLSGENNILTVCFGSRYGPGSLPLIALAKAS